MNIQHKGSALSLCVARPAERSEYVNGVFSSVALEGNKNGGKKGEGGGDGDRQNGLKAVCVFPLASYRFEFRRIAGDACFAL